MKITKIITAINDDNTYKDFLPLVSEAWKKLFGLDLIIGYVSDNKDEIKKLSNYGNIKFFQRIENIDSGVQAKITRMYLASSQEFINENCMIVDVDMVPLSKEVLSVFDQVPENKFVKWGYDHPAFGKGPDYGKWPMDRTSAKGSIFKEIINPNSLDYNQLLKSWEKFNIYGKEDITLPLNRFSDESLLRALYENWDKKETHTYKLSRLLLEKTMLCRRLDRTYPLQWNGLADKLKNNEFIEAHGLRPFKDNLYSYIDILKFFNIDINEFIQENKNEL